MKAIVDHRSGSLEGLRCEEVEKPVPKDDEVLIQVRAASVNPADWHLLRMPSIVPWLLGMPKTRLTRPGADVAGQVEAVGRDVTQFQAGDDVFGACHGAFAEYACAPESSLASKPANVTFEQAASAPVAGFTAVQGLRDKGHLQPGQKVLINGAAGGVGTFAVQIAKLFGAEVTGVCSTRNVEMVRSLGAHRVIDYTREDFIQSGQRYNLMFDLVANHPLSACRRVLTPGGIYVAAGALSRRGMLSLLGRMPALLFLQLVSRTFVTFMAKRSQKDLNLLRELMETGKLAPVIDRRYKLEQVPEALRYLAEGHARGKVMITLS